MEGKAKLLAGTEECQQAGFGWSQSPPELQQMSLSGLCWETDTGIAHPKHLQPQGLVWKYLILVPRLAPSLYKPLGGCRGKLRLRNAPRMAPSVSSREQNRLKTFHLGFNGTETTPACWGHPDPQREQVLGFGKAPGGRKSGAGRRKSTGEEQSPAVQELAGHQLGSSDLFIYIAGGAGPP